MRWNQAERMANEDSADSSLHLLLCLFHPPVRKALGSKVEPSDDQVRGTYNAIDRNWFGRLCSALVVAATLELLLVPGSMWNCSAKEQRSATSTSAAKAASAWP